MIAFHGGLVLRLIRQVNQAAPSPARLVGLLPPLLLAWVVGFSGVGTAEGAPEAAAKGTEELADLSRQVEALVVAAAPLRVTVQRPEGPLDAVLMDEGGHLIVPHALSKRRYTVEVCGQRREAVFVASDEAGAVSVLRVRDVPEEAQIPSAASQRPRNGELAVILPCGGGAGRLVVWQGPPNDEHLSGMVLVSNPDGPAVAGFLASGEFRPLDLARVMAAQLLAEGRVKRPRLGLLLGVTRLLPPEGDEDARAGQNHAAPDRQRTPGLTILRVLPDSAAATAGLREGDEVLTVEGRPVASISEFGGLLAGATHRITLTIRRGEESHEVVVDLPPGPGR